MYKFITALCLLFVSGLVTFAQEQTQAATATKTSDIQYKKRNLFDRDKNADAADPNQAASVEDYPKNEFYLGYSNQQVGRFGRSSFNGVQGAYVRNVRRFIGIRADFSYAQAERTLTGSIADTGGTVYNFQQTNFRSVTNVLGGVQIKDNASTKRFKPFAFALGGVAFNRATYKNLACSSAICPASFPIISNFTFRDTGLAGSFGGGLDIRINKRVDFRLIQVDYNPIYSNKRVDNNFRIGAGIVFR